MNTYTLQELSTMIDALTLRINALDGANLPYNQTGSVPAVIKQLNSIQTDLGQLGASFENQLSIINTKIAAIQNQINTLSGQPAQ